METKEVNYYFINLKGSAYQIGREQAASVKNLPVFRQWFAGNSEDWKEKKSVSAWKMFQQYCPGLVEELQGWADELEVSPAALVYSAHTYMVPHCSHFVLMPMMNSIGHVLLARSYEFDIETHDFRLCYTACDGRYAHLGNSVLFSGRLDGMNEHHLAVTMSSGGIPRNMVNPKTPPVQEGLQFWAVIRCILENCRTVDEAVTWLDQVPLGGNPIFLIADASGNAAKAECFGKKICKKRLTAGENEGFLFATNHYMTPEMQENQSFIMTNSLIREKSINELIQRNDGKSTAEDLKVFLSRSYPDGLCCHYYSEGFGTLYSMLLDITAGEMNICLGSPQKNQWMRFRFSDAAAMPVKIYPVILPQEKSQQSFWK